MEKILITLLLWAILASFLLIAALQKARLNEKRIFEIDAYLRKRIQRETGMNIYKDVK